jgi:hypothetical protein
MAVVTAAVRSDTPSLPNAQQREHLSVADVEVDTVHGHRLAV